MDSQSSPLILQIIINPINISTPFPLKFTPTTCTATFKTILILSSHLFLLYSVVNIPGYNSPLNSANISETSMKMLVFQVFDLTGPCTSQLALVSLELEIFIVRPNPVPRHCLKSLCLQAL